MNPSQEFLVEVFGENPPGKILIWEGGTKHSSYFGDPYECGDENFGRLDAYVGVATRIEGLGLYVRGSADQLSHLFGFWLDVDYFSEGAHAKKDLPPDEESAMKVVAEMPLKPTLVVHSGHGLQAWWLFKEPQSCSDQIQVNELHGISRLWQRHAQIVGRGMGWDVDQNHDLPRILRLPGTINGKVGGDHREVRILKKLKSRYVPTDFLKALEKAQGNAPDAVSPNWTPPVNGPGPSPRWDRDVLGTMEGERDTSLTRTVGKLFQMCEDVENKANVKMILTCARAVNLTFQPPLDDQDVRRIHGSIWNTEKKKRDAVARLDSVERVPEGAPRENYFEQIGKVLKCEILDICKYGQGIEASYNVKYVHPDGSGRVVDCHLPNVHGKAESHRVWSNTSDGLIKVSWMKPRDYDTLVYLVQRSARVDEMNDISIAEKARQMILRNFTEKPTVIQNDGNRIYSDAVKDCIEHGNPFIFNGVAHVCFSEVYSEEKSRNRINETERDLRTALSKEGWAVARPYFERKRNGVTVLVRKMFLVNDQKALHAIGESLRTDRAAGNGEDAEPGGGDRKDREEVRWAERAGVLADEDGFEGGPYEGDWDPGE